MNEPFPWMGMGDDRTSTGSCQSDYGLQKKSCLSHLKYECTGYLCSGLKGC